MMSHWRDRELGSVLSSTCRHLAWMNSPVVSEHLSESTFEPRWLHKSPTTVYLVLPPKYLSTLSRLMRLWVASIYGRLTEAGAQEDKKVLFLLDEVGNLGPLPQVYQAITLGRGYGIRVWLCLQSFSQLKSIFPAEGQAETVEASIDTRVFFGVRDYKTAEYLSNYLGQETVQVESTSTNQGASETGSLASLFTKSAGGHSRTTSTGTGTNQSEVGRALLQPAEILRLRKDVAIVLTPSLPPIKCDLAKYYATPELADAVLANRPSTADQEG
jgi:type IV secretion system protein VirD4